MPGRFLRIACDGCGNEQVVYSHSSTSVRCSVCGRTLVKPRGGKAEIFGTIKEGDRSGEVQE